MATSLESVNKYDDVPRAKIWIMCVGSEQFLNSFPVGELSILRPKQITADFGN